MVLMEDTQREKGDAKGDDAPRVFHTSIYRIDVVPSARDWRLCKIKSRSSVLLQSFFAATFRAAAAVIESSLKRVYVNEINLRHGEFFAPVQCDGLRLSIYPLHDTF